MNSKSLIQKITDMKVVLLLQAIASVLLLFFIFKLNMLPMLYFVIVAIILLILWGIMFALIRVKKQKSKRSILGKVISIILSILLLFTCLSVVKGDNLIARITGAKHQTQVISVIVMKASEAEELSDLKGKSFGINAKTDTENSTTAIAEIEKEINKITITDNESFSTLVTSLYEGKVDAILVNEAYRGNLEEEKPDFTSETRVIHTVEIEEKIEDVTTAVDVTKSPFNIYISGIDTYGPVNTVSRTDVNILVTVNPKTRQILMTSIPRDSYVTLATPGKKDKLTHSGIYGVNETIKTVSQWLNTDINYYARVNFTSLTSIVDALGGVTVDNPVAFTASDGTYSYAKGNINLDGKKALRFVRERYNLANGDFDRGQNQMRVLSAMFSKMTSPAIITNYSSVLDSIGGSFQTNMESGDITSLVKMQLDDMSGWTISSQQVTGKGQTGGLSSYAMPGYQLYMMVPDATSVARVESNIDKVINGEKPVVSE